MNICGRFGCDDNWLGPEGAFTQYQQGSNYHNVSGGGNTNWYIDFSASRNWTGLTSSARTSDNKPTEIYGKNDTVQPPALKYRVKTRIK